MTRRGPSRRRLSGSLRRRQGSALRADPFGASTSPRTTRVVGAPADGLDRSSREPTAGSYVMARLSDPVESSISNAHDAIDDANRQTGCGIDISIARCRELLGEEAELMTDRDIAEIRRHAEMMAWIVIDMYEKHRRVPE